MNQNILTVMKREKVSPDRSEKTPYDLNRVTDYRKTTASMSYFKSNNTPYDLNNFRKKENR
jgi:hypothetical protein